MSSSTTSGGCDLTSWMSANPTGLNSAVQTKTIILYMLRLMSAQELSTSERLGELNCSYCRFDILLAMETRSVSSLMLLTV